MADEVSGAADATDSAKVMGAALANAGNGAGNGAGSDAGTPAPAAQTPEGSDLDGAVAVPATRGVMPAGATGIAPTDTLRLRPACRGSALDG